MWRNTLCKRKIQVLGRWLSLNSKYEHASWLYCNSDSYQWEFEGVGKVIPDIIITPNFSCLKEYTIDFFLIRFALYHLVIERYRDVASADEIGIKDE